MTPRFLLLFRNYFNNYLIVLVGDVSFSNQTFIKPLNYPPTPAYKKSHNYYPWKCELKEPDKPSIRRNIYLKQIISFSPWSVYSYHTLFNCQRMFLISPEIEYLIVRFFYLKKMERKNPITWKMSIMILMFKMSLPYRLSYQAYSWQSFHHN